MESQDRTVYGEICDGLMDVLNEDEGRGTVINVRNPEKNIYHLSLRELFFTSLFFYTQYVSFATDVSNWTRNYSHSYYDERKIKE